MPLGPRGKEKRAARPPPSASLRLRRALKKTGVGGTDTLAADWQQGSWVWGIAGVFLGAAGGLHSRTAAF